MAPTATFNAPASVIKTELIQLSLTGPVDPSSVDHPILQYAFDCGLGYGGLSPNNNVTCSSGEGPSTLTVKGKVQDKDGGFTEYTSVVAVLVPSAPDFSIDAAPVAGACICTPLVMNTVNTGVEHWWVKADGSGTLTLTVTAHAVNPTDPETVVARIFPVSGVGPALGVASASYPGGTPAGTEVDASVSIGTTAGTVYLVRVTTPSPTPPTQPHYRLKFNGASEAAIKSPTFRSFEPETPVRWYVNVGASESLSMRIFGEGVPLPLVPGTSMFSYQFDGDAAATVSAAVTPGPFGGYSATAVPSASPAGKREFAMLSTSFSPDPPGGGIHYRLEALGIADKAVYLGPLSYGYGDIAGAVLTSGGTPFPGPVTVKLYEGPSGPFIGSTVAGAGTFSFPNLFVGTYRVEVVPPGGTNIVGLLSYVVVVTCDMDSPVSFVLNRPPDADAGPDQSVGENTGVSLDGTGSSDPDLNPLSYSWVQTSGPVVTLSGAITATPAFTAPNVPAEIGSVTLTFESTVDDGFGRADTDTVTVVVNDVRPDPGNGARTIGYWKNHESQIQAMLTQDGPINLGDTTVATVAQAKSVLSSSSAKDARDSLRAQLLATILNLRNGSDPLANGPNIIPTVWASQAFLASHPTAVDGKHPDRAAALSLKDTLDAYNNSGE